LNSFIGLDNTLTLILFWKSLRCQAFWHWFIVRENGRLMSEKPKFKVKKLKTAAFEPFV